MINKIKFSNKKISFKLPRKVHILIYSNMLIRQLVQVIDSDSYELLDFNEVNIFVLLLCFLKLNVSTDSYIKNYIYYFNPKIIITALDDDIKFYQIKYHHPKIKTISIQYGNRGIISFEKFYKYSKAKGELQVDHLIVFSNKEVAQYKDVIKCENIHILGSLKNNMFLKKWNVTEDVVFISQYREDSKNHPEFFNISGKSVLKDDFYKVEKKLLPVLLDFCSQNNLNLVICGAGRAKDEYDFFQRTIGSDKFIFKEFTTEMSSYDNSNNCRFAVSIDSTLGLEIFGRKIPIAFFPSRSKFINLESFKSILSIKVLSPHITL